MKFAQPDMLLAFLLVPVLILLFAWAGVARRKARDKFALPSKFAGLSPAYSRTGRVARYVLFLIAVVFFVLAAARPQWGTHAVMMKRQGLDIMVILDVSNSMNAEDMKPSRLEKAKQEIRGIVERLSGDRIGLVLFAGKAFVHCPLTLDYSAFNMFMDVVDTDIIPAQGTAIGDAIRVANSAFDQKEKKYKVAILMTDGEDHESDPIKASEEARDLGVKIFTIGIGSVRGEPIPIKNRRGEIAGYKKDESGEVVMTKLDEGTLERIADITGGEYYRATAGELELDRIYDEILGMEKKELEGKLMTQYEDRFQYPLAAGLFFIVIEFFVNDRKIGSERRRSA